MFQVDELERCYTGVATAEGIAIHFFDGEALQPIAPRYTFACGHRLGGALEERENVAFTLLSDHLRRWRGLSQDAADIGAQTLMRAFAEQFLGVDPRCILFIEEHRIEDWVRVMRMLSEAA